MATMEVRTKTVNAAVDLVSARTLRARLAERFWLMMRTRFIFSRVTRCRASHALPATFGNSMPAALAVRLAARALARTLATARRAPAIAATSFFFRLFYSLTFFFLNLATFFDVSM